MGRRLRPLGALVGDESGVTAIVFALSMTVLMGFAGMAIDTGLWYADERSAQGAADSAAYSAALASFDGESTANAGLAAKAITTGYGFTDGSGGVTVAVNHPPTLGAYTSNAKAFEVIITKTESLFFSKFFLNSASIKARAVGVAGTVAGNGNYCIEALDPGSGMTVDVTQGAAVDGCGMQVNGSGSGALTITQAVNAVDVVTLSVVGNIATSNGGTYTVTGTKTTGAAALADPYASVATPTAGACTAQAASYSSGTNTINPGTFCSGLSLYNGATLNMNPGVYIVSGNYLGLTDGVVNANYSLSGVSGVTIVLTGTTYATISNNVTLNLTAPTTGPTAGLAIMQDRAETKSVVDASGNCTPTAACENTIAGGAAINVVGAMYFPSQRVQISNGSYTTTSTCTQLIAYDLQFMGGTNYVNTGCSGKGVNGIGVSSSATALVE